MLSPYGCRGQRSSLLREDLVSLTSLLLILKHYRIFKKYLKRIFEIIYSTSYCAFPLAVLRSKLMESNLIVLVGLLIPWTVTSRSRSKDTQGYRQAELPPLPLVRIQGKFRIPQKSIKIWDLGLYPVTEDDSFL